MKTVSVQSQEVLTNRINHFCRWN